MFICIFGHFPVAGNKEKKMKKKTKKKGAENLFGLLPNCIVKKKIVLPHWVCITRGRLDAGERVTIQKFYCDKEQQVG